MGVKAWITVNGNHIPIMDGESKMQAVGRFIKGKRDASKRRMKEMDRELSGDLPHTTKDIYNKYNKEADRYKKLGGGTAVKGKARTRQEINRDIDRFNSNVSKFENKGLSYDDAVTEAEIANNWKNPYKERASSKMAKDYYNDKRYKLKEDRIKKTPVSSINVDTTSFRGTHGKEPGSLRVGGSSRGNWAFKLGNETVFINDTYSNAKKQALKEASRRGLWSIKVLG